jgi:hypothetical protein
MPGERGALGGTEVIKAVTPNGLFFAVPLGSVALPDGSVQLGPGLLRLPLGGRLPVEWGTILCPNGDLQDRNGYITPYAAFAHRPP